MRERGFTLLEVLVATTIMGIAVVGLLSGISSSMRNAARLTEHDRAALLARAKMDELLVERTLPRLAPFGGNFDPALTGGMEAGWRARVSKFEAPLGAPPGTPVLDRIELEIWWSAGEQRRSYTLEAFRPYVLTPQDVVPGVPQ